MSPDISRRIAMLWLVCRFYGFADISAPIILPFAHLLMVLVSRSSSARRSLSGKIMANPDSWYAQMLALELLLQYERMSQSTQRVCRWVIATSSSDGLLNLACDGLTDEGCVVVLEHLWHHGRRGNMAALRAMVRLFPSNEEARTLLKAWAESHMRMDESDWSTCAEVKRQFSRGRRSLIEPW
jgi:hypothetical protein